MAEDPWAFDPPVESPVTFDEIVEMFDGLCSAHMEIAELIPECGVCGVKGGDPCVNSVTGKVTKIPHVKRINAARKAGW